MTDFGAGTSTSAGAEDPAGSRYMDELTSRLLSQAQEMAAAEAASEAPRSEELDSTTAASLETFMASLKAHLQLAPEPWHEERTARRRMHSWSTAERHARIREVVREQMRQAAHGTPLGVQPLMTTVRCLHASVAQKSYGTEKRFLCPPPAVNVRGALRHTEHAVPALFMQIQSEDGERFSGEQLAALDEAHQARFTELHVTGTGKAKSFRLQLHLLARREQEAREAKRQRVDEHDTSASWASFDSAPIGIISKPSKKSAKARHASAHITSNASVSLFNRINSQTYRTKYLSAHEGHLSAQSRAWTAFRLVLLARPPQAQALDVDADVLTYGSTIVLVDEVSGATTDPLLVCKVDRGRILPPLGEARVTLDDGTLADESYLYGAVSQMQKIALMRFVPNPHRAEGHWERDAHAPRTYLCAGTPLHASAQHATLRHLGVPPPAPPDDAHALPLTYVAAKPAAWDGATLDDAEDAFCWTLVSISHFEYSFIDVDMLDTPNAPPGAGLALTPFPIVTTMPFYDTNTHKVAMTVQHFFYDAHALQSLDEPLLEHMEVWLGPLGPLALLTAPTPDGEQETDVAVHLPPLRAIIDAGDASPQCTLPLLFVRALDGAIYHSGRQVACQDLVAVVRAAGDSRAAEALKKLNVGLGEQAGAQELPPGSVWTLRVV